MNNTVTLILDKNLRYDIEKLDELLFEKIGMELLEPIQNNTLFYDGCIIKLIKDVLVFENNYYRASKDGIFITEDTATVLKYITRWTRDTYYKYN